MVPIGGNAESTSATEEAVGQRDDRSAFCVRIRGSNEIVRVNWRSC